MSTPSRFAALSVLSLCALAPARSLDSLFIPDYSGIVAAYSFDEGDGATLHDRTGHGHDGAVTGAVWDAGLKGGALRFDGAGRVVIPPSAAFQTKSFTIAFWTRSSTTLTDMPLVEFSRPGHGAGVCVWANTEGNSTVTPGTVFFHPRSNVHENVNYFYTAGSLVPAGAWTHIAVTYDFPSRIALIYVNGEEKARNTLVDTLTSTEGDLYLGYRPLESLDDRAGVGLQGKLDELVIYDHAVAAGTIAEIYRKDAPPAPPAPGPGDDLLRFDFRDSAALGKQTGPLPDGEVSGAVTHSRTYPGAADFGAGGGFVRVSPFKAPRGSFTIEARFRLRSYGPESSRFVADILNTATIDNGPSQGFAFRVGGSYLYPPLPRDAYATEAEWTAAQNAYTYIDRGRLSYCFAELAMARVDDWRAWKEVYTDRCIELNQWTHLVATWDGGDMRIYLDGAEATDKWRVQGKGIAPLIDSVETAYVGSRIEGDWDPRHLDGALDFVRVQNGALTADEIRARYRETFVPEARDSLCTGVIIPRKPEAGQVCGKQTGFEIEVTSHGACSDTAFKAGFAAGDSIEVEFSKDPSFDPVALRLVAGARDFRLSGSDYDLLAQIKQEIYWRARLIHPAIAQGLLKKSTVASARGAWSLPRPVLLNLAEANAVLPRPQRLRPVLVQPGAGLFVPGDAQPFLFDLSGKRMPLRFTAVTGGWRLEKSPANAGVFLLGR